MGALALGVQAFVDGRIAAVERDPETGRPALVQGAWVESAEWADLLVALGPGWPAGLLAALEHLQVGTEQVVQARGPHPSWSLR